MNELLFPFTVEVPVFEGVFRKNRCRNVNKTMPDAGRCSWTGAGREKSFRRLSEKCIASARKDEKLFLTSDLYRN